MIRSIRHQREPSSGERPRRENCNMPVNATEAELKRRIRSELPPEAFRRRPLQLLWALPIVGVIVGGSAALLRLAPPWWIALPAALVLGNCYAALLLLAHDTAHGATIRSRRLQDALLYLALAVFWISPILWRHWHNAAHHGHTNDLEDRDPDALGLFDSAQTTGWAHRLRHVVPGAGHLFGFVSMLAGFTIQGQNVLWWHGRVGRDFARMPWRRAAGESLGMIIFWLALAAACGWPGALWVVAAPMLTANFVVMSYIVTNHFVRHLSDANDALDTSMSVRTPAWLDRLHFHFSHHVEHHLFPSMSSSRYPLVRRWLMENAGDRYVAPAHWRALRAVFRTPRFYSDPHTLTSLHGALEVPIAEIEAMLAERGRS